MLVFFQKKNNLGKRFNLVKIFSKLRFWLEVVFKVKMLERRRGERRVNNGVDRNHDLVKLW